MAKNSSPACVRDGSFTSRNHTGVMNIVSKNTTMRRMRRYVPISGGK